jgi:hypothetical protein
MKVTIGLSSIQWLFIVANKWHYLSMRMFIHNVFPVCYMLGIQALIIRSPMRSDWKITISESSDGTIKFMIIWGKHLL